MSGDRRDTDVDPERARIVVELLRGSDPIRGSVTSEAMERGFSGWMELIDALEHARLLEAPAGTREPDRRETGEMLG